ncbi:MAG: glutamine synthetase family protein [Lachnospiraceae bacterium]|nr:glutamine synthetase family protein [Lachnospiraceae bacterium]
MNYSKEEVKEFIEQEDVKFVRLAFCDINGKQKNISISPSEIDRAFDEGISFDASGIEGFGHELRTDLMLHPISKTLNVLPWRPSQGKVIRMFCNIKYPDGTPFEIDTRQILQNAVKEAKNMGLTVQFGTEFEFYLFKTDENGNKTNIPFDNAGYMDVAPEDKGENIRREICLTLLEMGINPESSLHLDGPGQNEIDFRYADALTAADNAMNFVSVVKAAALHNGLYADFSPKPIMDKPGNGLHINISVKSEDGLFYNAKFMAGVMDHICEITAFLNTKEASYKRLGEHTAPKYVTWTKENRSQLLRVPERRNEHKRFELRSPDPCANPYLAFAMLIYAGLDGIKRNLELPAPFDTNIKDSEQSVKDSLKKLPDSLEAAVELATKSEFVNSVISKEVLNLL